MKKEKIRKEITERRLKMAIRWFLIMNTWEFTEKALKKSEKEKQILWDYIEGKIFHKDVGDLYL